ncbi:MAG: hypothetical protein ACI9WN_000524, partial [Porticoccus sp.]
TDRPIIYTLYDNYYEYFLHECLYVAIRLLFMYCMDVKLSIY